MSEAIKPTPGPWKATEKTVTAPETEDRLGMECRLYGGNGHDNRANARLIAEAGTVAHETGLTPRQLVERVKELEEALQRLLGPADDPNAGWRGAGGTDVLFACEHCRATSEDSTKIEHADDCPIAQARAAISKSLPNTVAEVK